MSENEVVTFTYPSESVAAYCEEKARRVEDWKQALVRVNVQGMWEMGRCLEAAKRKLPHGSYKAWLRWRFPGWSYDTMHRWRVFAERIDKLAGEGQEALLDVLDRFLSSEAALEYPALPEPVQRRVVDAGAWTWTRFQAECWRARMDEHLADCDLERDHRCGDVYHAIQEVNNDPDAPEPLRQAAAELFEEHEEEFARLSDRQPAEVAVEVGIQWKEPPRDDRPWAALTPCDDGALWLCRWTGESFEPVLPVTTRLEMMNGGTEPVLLAAFPKTTDGPTAAAWQRAVMDAAGARVNASTLGSMYGESL